MSSPGFVSHPVTPPPSAAREREVTVPGTREGYCLGPEGNGVRSKEGGEGGPGPPDWEGDSSQLPARKEATWRRKKKEGQVRRDEEGLACTE